MTYTYNFPFDSKYSTDSGAFNGYYSPSYSLGVLSAGYSLNIKVSMQGKNTQDLSSLAVNLYGKVGSGSYGKVGLTPIKVTSTSKEYEYSIP